MGRHADLVQTELESLSHGALIGLLENAEDEEREMSYHRRLLHKRIDSLDVASGVLERADAELLSALHLEGRALSELRLQLHHRITHLRLEIGWRRRRPH